MKCGVSPSFKWSQKSLRTLARHLFGLHSILFARSRKTQPNAARQYDAATKELELNVRDCVLMW